MMHIYYGDGKGKTTAALGLALRWVGRGGKVVIAQFLKGADSGERVALQAFPNVTLLPVPETEITEIPYDELMEMKSLRMTGSLGSSGK